jgi:OOP family OmpA-OmpF porin
MKRYAAPACVLALVGLLAAAPAAAEKLGWYTGIGGGLSYGTLDEESIQDELATATPGLTVGSINRDSSSWTAKILLGYSFTSFLAVEANAFWLGGFDTDGLTTPSGGFRANTEVRGLGLDILGILPLGERWRAIARVGGVYAQTKTDLEVSGVPVIDPTGKDLDLGWKAGLGLGYEFDSGAAFRAEWEHYRVKDGFDEWMDVDTFTATALYRFQ